ncbi:hypothetical protein GCM10022293_58740 [Azospirillum formosense]
MDGRGNAAQSSASGAARPPSAAAGGADSIRTADSITAADWAASRIVGMTVSRSAALVGTALFYTEAEARRITRPGSSTAARIAAGPRTRMGAMAILPCVGPSRLL